MFNITDTFARVTLIDYCRYIYPLTFRTKMAALFQDPSCMHWWLPNDDSYPPIIRSIRRFVEERTSVARDLPAEDLRDMKAIFSSMKIDDGKQHIAPRIGPSKHSKDKESVAVAGDQWSTQGMGTDDSRNTERFRAVGDEQFGMGYEEEPSIWTGTSGGRDL